MAKNKNKAKKGVAGLVVAIAGSAIVVGAVAGVIGYGTDGFKDWSFNNYSHKVEYVIPSTDKTENTEITAIESNGIQLMSARIAPEDYEEYGISAQSDTESYIISATFTPAETTNKGVVWTVSGANDRLSVTPVEGNPLQATITAEVPFAVVGQVTCTSVADSSVKASALIKCLASVKGDETIDNNTASLKNDPFSFYLSYGIGTSLCDPEFATGKVDIVMNSGLYNSLTSKGHNVVQRKTVINSDAEVDIVYYGDENEGWTFNESFMPDLTEEQKNAVYADIYSYYEDKSHAEIYKFEVFDVNVEYNGGVTRSYEGLVQTQFNYYDITDLYVGPGGISLDIDTIYFGG